MVLDMDNKNERITIRVPSALTEKAAKIAAELGMTPSQVFRNSILAGIGKYEKIAADHEEAIQ